MDMTETYKKAWKDKSAYQFIEISDDCRLSMYDYYDGSVTKLGEYFLDPETMTLHISSDFSTAGTGEEFLIENGVITLKSDNYHIEYELTDEIPDFDQE